MEKEKTQTRQYTSQNLIALERKGKEAFDLPSECIGLKLVEHIVRIHNIPNTLGHFLALTIVDKAVRKDGSR